MSTEHVSTRVGTHGGFIPIARSGSNDSNDSNEIDEIDEIDNLNINTITELSDTASFTRLATLGLLSLTAGNGLDTSSVLGQADGSIVDGSIVDGSIQQILGNKRFW